MCLIQALFFPSFSLSLSLACLLHYTHLCPPQFFKTDCPPSRRFAASPLALSATLGKLKKKREKNNCALSVRKKKVHFQTYVCLLSEAGGKYLFAISGKRREGLFLCLPCVFGSDYHAVVFAPFSASGWGCMQNLLLPPKRLGKKTQHYIGNPRCLRSICVWS